MENTGGQVGDSNVVLGSESGQSLTTGGANVFIGRLAGGLVTTGGYNVCIGLHTGYAQWSGVALTTGEHNILIGHASEVAAADDDHCIVVGCKGDANTDGAVGKGDDTGFINANGGGNYAGNNSASWSTTSDRRIKKNIVDSTAGLAEINQIQVRNFEYRLPEEVDKELPQSAAIEKEGIQVGVIAQEVMDILPDIVKQESTGCYSVDPDNLTWHLVKAVQELTARIEELKKESTQ
jgi:hypothetical protein